MQPAKGGSKIKINRSVTGKKERETDFLRLDMEKILIVDDSEMNREILTEMLGGEYEILEACNGKEAITVMNKSNTDIALVLLDMVMPEMNGIEVLDVMKKNNWLADIPVIMISAEDSDEVIHSAYELGVTEFIRRPFDQLIVQKRCQNVINLYAKQKKLAGLVADQFYEREQESRLMIDILAHIVEFRNNESGLHVIHVQNYTEILLRELAKITDKYGLDSDKIALITKTAALHDVGKICIPDEILNKPGRLTDEEFKIMKSHSAVGSQMLADLPFHKEEPLVKMAYAVARWHHERWDGRGYPDGLVGDEIPVEAQVVALADVYDALTSERCYKKAFSHATALEMITKGECGQFNPLLITCLNNAAEEMRLVKEGGANSNADYDVREYAMALLKSNELNSSDRLLHLLEYEKMKNRFFEGITGGCSFEYNADSKMLTISANLAEALGVEETIIDPIHSESLIKIFGQEKLKELAAKCRSLPPDNPITQFNLHILTTNKSDSDMPARLFRITDVSENNVKCPANTQYTTYRLICRAAFTIAEPQRYTGVIGKLVPSEREYGIMKGVDLSDFTGML